MNWYIGQDIVAIVNHSKGQFKEGDVFKIRSLKEMCCKECGTQIDIGHKTYSGTICSFCRIEDINERIAWFSETCFAPLDSLCNISELTEILENTKPFEVK